MALNRQKNFHNAERLLKQGKVQAALGELERLAAAAPTDLLALNRIGDLLARQGRGAEAAGFYHKIATQFTKQGFFPKAVAIRKKILRLDPGNAESLAELGDLYLRQKLPGEARAYLLRAAEEHLQKRGFAAAREVYERLAAAEPDDVRHRARVAEARAAEGDLGRAGEDLLELGDMLFSSGQPAEAEQSYRRAAELLPDRGEPVLGLAHCLTEKGQEQDALALLEQRAASGGPGQGAVVGELFLRYELTGRSTEALGLLRQPGAEQVPDDAILKAFSHQMHSGDGDRLWQRLDPVFRRWGTQAPDRMIPLYRELGGLEDQGHIPALQRLLELQRDGADRAGMANTLERLVQAYKLRSMHDEASLMLDQLRQVAPKSRLIDQPAAADPARPHDTPLVGPTPAVSDAASTVAEEPLPAEFEAPAVPLNAADEEFVTGRMTQAEILEKYGLKEQALVQVREVTGRFSGHVLAQRRAVELLRGMSDPGKRREALLGLAVACRASGDYEAGADAAREAGRIAPLGTKTRRRFERLGLLEARTAPEAAEPAVAAPKTPAPITLSRAAAPPAPEAAGPTEADDAVLIDFDAASDEAEAPAPAAGQAEVRPPSTPAPGDRPGRVATRAPGEDMLEEIREYLAQGKAAEANKRVGALRTLGYGSDALELLAAEIGHALQSATAPPTVDTPAQPVSAAPEVAGPTEPGTPDPVAAEELVEPEADVDRSVLETLELDDDLSSITAALENDLFGELDDPAFEPAQAESEQSLEDVFAAFKQHVDQEVDSEDFQTHYDLGIAYKEMGLLDEALGEFQQALKCEFLYRESCTMLAICHRERSEFDEAVDWYQQALDAPGGDSSSLAGLRYDLAEALIEAGKLEAALDMFRDVMEVDPSFRDVQARVAQLEA